MKKSLKTIVTMSMMIAMLSPAVILADDEEVSVSFEAPVSASVLNSYDDTLGTNVAIIDAQPGDIDTAVCEVRSEAPEGSGDVLVEVTSEDEPEVQEVKEVKEVKDEQRYIELGTYRLTGYCSCKKCCGNNTATRMGTKPVAGRTIAVDPKVIPLGSHVQILINGTWRDYIAEDTGGGVKKNHIDIYMPTHSSCFSTECNGTAQVRLVK